MFFFGSLFTPELDELVIEVVALARALADAGEHRKAAMRLGDVVDQLLDDHGLADAGAAEQADLAALGVGREQVDDLDAGGEDVRLGRLVGIERRVRVDRARLRMRDGAGLIDRVADDIDDAPERALADRHRDRQAGVDDLLSAHEAFGRVHGDGADGRFAEMLRDLEHQALTLVLRLERVQDRRQLLPELHVDDRADHLRDASDQFTIGIH